MINEVLAWLNGTRSWKEGVSLYLRYGQDEAFKKELQACETQELRTRLFICIKDLLYKANDHADSLRLAVGTLIGTSKPYCPEKIVFATPPPELSDLASDTKRDADRLYKEMQNVRAQMLALCSPEQRPGENEAHLVQQRGALAMRVLELQTEVDAAYSRHRYVRLHGRLPGVTEDDKVKEISSVDLAREIDNTRKYIRRWEKAEEGPKRTAKLHHYNTLLTQLTLRYEQEKAGGSGSAGQ